MKLKDLKYLLLIIFSTIVVSCDEGINNNNNNFTNSIGYNIYKKDENLQKINDYRQAKDVDIILQYSSSNNSAVKREVILSLSVVADSNEIISVVPFLRDNDPHVRVAAAFALGQSYSAMHETRLIEAYKTETDDYVKQSILIAIGKCGTSSGLDFITALNLPEDNEILLQGQGRAFYYLSKKGLFTSQMTDKAMQIISNPNISQNAKLAFSYYIASNQNIDLGSYFEVIENELKTNSNVYLLANLAASIKHMNSQRSIDLLKSIVRAEADYRIKISALEALSVYNYSQVKDVMLEAVQFENGFIANTAANFFLTKGNRNDANEYFSTSKHIIPWKARTTMITSALQYSSNKTSIVNSIISGYNAVENKYEKAALLYALSADPAQYKFVKDEAFSSTDKIISTAGIKSLYSMRLNPNFDAIARTVQQNTGTNLYAEFTLIFQEAMTSGNKMMIYYASKIFARRDLNIIDEYENTYYMTQASNLLDYPADIIILKEVCKTLLLYGNQPCTKKDVEVFKIDWDFVNSIKSEQRVLVKTSRGDFEMTLDVNSAPVTVGVFLDLVKSGYYNNTYFFKNIPGKAIVNGGKRGDGEMNFNMSLVNEINLKNFQDGSVAMRILDDDYQSVNWFITTAPNIDYDNNFTIFAEVSKGLDIVHNLEEGDKIIEVIIL
ncbi:MAG: peptidylprolyl isomerase [Bacteroidales bacterium]|nr:peptidylprolyl isomerase [Bacteroidales bacterium]